MSSRVDTVSGEEPYGVAKWIAVRAAPGLALLIIWQAAYASGVVSRLVLPSPGGVWHAMVIGLSGGGDWWVHIGVTLEETVIAFVSGSVAALLLGAVFALFKPVRDSVLPYVVALQNFPKIAIAPLLVTWLGYGLAPKVVIGALLAFFPVLINTVAGLREMGDDELELFRSLRASPVQEFLYLRIPNALAYIFPALTLAAVGSLLGVIVGEFVGSRAGLGYLILQQTFTGDIAATYGTLMILAVIGAGIFSVLKWVERKTKFSRNR